MAKKWIVRVNLPDALRRDAKITAAQDGITLQLLVETALVNEIATRAVKPKRKRDAGLAR